MSLSTIARRRRAGSPALAMLAAVALLAAGCGGGGGGNDAGTAGGGGSGSGSTGGGGTSQTPVPPEDSIAGTVSFDYVPISVGTSGPRLDYGRTEARPARGVTVQAVYGASVLAATTTDAQGRYLLPRDVVREGARIVVRAEMLQSATPTFDFRVVDNTNGEALYVLESSPFPAGSSSTIVDLHAASGWDNGSYSEARSAAPFAILDVVYEAVQRVGIFSPVSALPPLALHWSTQNVPNRPEDGIPDYESGEIGSSQFVSGLGIYLVGAADSDTDEYDRHVIAHEWGHYLEHSISRSDSTGGPHTRGDQLDPRTAYSEGLANALSAIVVGDSIYKDTLGPRQSLGFTFNVEGPFYSGGQPNPHPGWFSEETVQELVWDFYDDTADIAEDTLALGVAELTAAMAGPVKSTSALASIFPFVEALKQTNAGEAPQIDLLVQRQEIEPVADAFGSGEDNAGEPTAGGSGGTGGLLGGGGSGSSADDVLPIYKTIEVNGGPVSVCSTDDYTSEVTGGVNKLGSRAFLRFGVSTPGLHTVSAQVTEAPSGEVPDPDMQLYRRGALGLYDAAPDESVCTGDTQLACAEIFSRSLDADEYVLEVYEWTNTTDDEEYPPIGRVCFDVEITR